MKNILFKLFLSIVITAALFGCNTEDSERDSRTRDYSCSTDLVRQELGGGTLKPFVPYSEMKRLWTEPRKISPSISGYDNIIRAVARSEGYDWRLISAIAYAESRFNHLSVSHVGARGLMQIMPIVAQQFGIEQTEITDPRTNVWLGIELLSHIESNLRFSRSATEQDRLCIILAAYNCGTGHVLDARRLARKDGRNPDSWQVISQYLKFKFNPEYYMDDAVLCGQFEDSDQTLTFVNKVLGRYNRYCEEIPL